MGVGEREGGGGGGGGGGGFGYIRIARPLPHIKVPGEIKRS